MIAKNNNITLHQLAITGYQPRHPEYDHAAAALITADDTVIPASLIIAADGGNSPLRQFAGIRHITRNLGQTAIVSQIKMTDPNTTAHGRDFLLVGQSR